MLTSPCSIIPICDLETRSRSSTCKTLLDLLNKHHWCKYKLFSTLQGGVHREIHHVYIIQIYLPQIVISCECCTILVTTHRRSCRLLCFTHYQCALKRKKKYLTHLVAECHTHWRNWLIFWAFHSQNSMTIKAQNFTFQGFLETLLYLELKMYLYSLNKANNLDSLDFANQTNLATSILIILKKLRTNG